MCLSFKSVNFALLFSSIIVIQGCTQDDILHIDAPIEAVPVIYQDAVFFSDEKSIYSIDISTGMENFRITTSTGVTSGLTIHQDALYFGGDNGDIISIDLKSQKKNWNYDGKISVYSKPTIDNDLLYFGSSNEIVALDRSSGSFLWRYPLPSEDEFVLNSGGVSYSSAVVDTDNMYIGTEKGNLYALDKQTGAEKWMFSTDDGIDYTADNIDTSALINGDTIYVTETKFLLHAIDISTGELRWSYKTRLPGLSTPVMDDKKIYVSTWTSGGLPGEGTKGELYAIAINNGELSWSLDVGSGLSAAPYVKENSVYVGTWDGDMTAVNAETGKLIWSYNAGNILPGQALEVDGKVIFASYYCLEGTCTGSGEIDNHASTLIALEKESGELIWQFSGN